MLPSINAAPWRLSLAASIFIVTANNSQLFAALFDLLDISSLPALGFLLTILLLMVMVLNVIFMTLGIGPLLKVIVATALITSAGLGYFVNEMGVVFDQDMLSNIADTIRERNIAEARELGSRPLLVHMLLFGIIPSSLLLFIRLTPRSPMLELRDRFVGLMAGVIIVGALGFSDFRYITYFAVEHRDLRLKITPIFPLISLVKQARDSLVLEQKFSTLAADATQEKVGQRRTVGIMIVGETARADRFSLNGYERTTNPVLENEKGVLFVDADSCGTSTAYSVPCMFFLRGHENYSPDAARAESNVLDALTTAGVETVWIDNNSTCKHVCDRIENENLRIKQDGTTQFDGDYDIELVKATERYLASDGPDLLIVLHMMGSHGPAYSHRYPASSAVFSPYCTKLSPKECNVEEVRNAYDNSIAYTDFILGKLIARLKARSKEFDSFLLYASDHGESLGENGVYLHGLPRLVAPETQTNVPLIVWLSPEYSKTTHLQVADAIVNSETRLTHDNISPTLLGLYGVHTESYVFDADIFGRARSAKQSEAAVTTR